MKPSPRWLGALGAALIAGGYGMVRMAATQQTVAGENASTWWNHGYTEHSRVTIVSRSAPRRSATDTDAVSPETRPLLKKILSGEQLEEFASAKSPQEIIERLTALAETTAEDAGGATGLMDLLAEAIANTEAGADDAVAQGGKASILPKGVHRVAHPTKWILEAGLGVIVLGACLAGLGVAMSALRSAAAASEFGGPLRFPTRKYSGLPIPSAGLGGLSLPSVSTSKPKKAA